MGLVVALAACGTAKGLPVTKTEQHAWILGQQARFDAASTHYAPGYRWRDVYEALAQRIWEVGHNGADFPLTHVWPDRDTEPARALVASGFKDATNMAGEARFVGSSAGLEIVAPIGTSVYAARGGLVVHALQHPETKLWGVSIRSNNLTTSYVNLSEIEVTKGDTVDTGQLVGYVGAVDATVIPTLYFSLNVKGEYQDPMPLFPDTLQWPL